MRNWAQIAGFSALALLLAGCAAGGERNPFLTLTETLGISSAGGNTDSTGGGGTAASTEFRRSMQITFANNHPTADLTTSFVAWVTANSIRSAEQQDALLRSGYVQLTREVRLGTVFTLPVGTFVFNGPGTAGATPIRLNQATGGTATTQTISLTTPDVVLVFLQPPVSCDTVAFYYSVDGDILTSEPVGGGINIFEGATGGGGFKTLAQVDAYQCDPLTPGLFLKIVGGAVKPNEFFEGDNIRFDFFEQPSANGDFATVTIQGD